MRGNIIDYVHNYGMFDFKALPFQEVDALVLARFVYLKVENIIQPGYAKCDAMTLTELQAHPKVEQLFVIGDDDEENDRALFGEMCASKRFGSMICAYVVAKTSVELETQFMAMSCIFPDGSTKVLFRGTDGTAIGWKENFNMAFQCPVMAQKSAAEYLQRVMRLKRGRFDVIGHSKGGNLAVYATIYGNWFMQRRISRIYNLDGPGFRSEVFANSNYMGILPKIIKIIPRTCAVGMLLESHSTYKAVDTKGFFMAQHDLYAWPVDRTELVYIDDEAKIQRIFDERLCEKLMSLPKEDLEDVVNSLYQTIVVSDDAGSWDSRLKKRLTALKSIEGETWDILQGILHTIFRKE